MTASTPPVAALPDWRQARARLARAHRMGESKAELTAARQVYTASRAAYAITEALAAAPQLRPDLIAALHDVLDGTQTARGDK